MASGLVLRDHHHHWVLAGAVYDKYDRRESLDTCYHSTTLDDTLKRFWEMEEYDLRQPVLSLEERAVIKYFRENYCRDEHGRCIVPLPIRMEVTPRGESRLLAVKRFETLERMQGLNRS